MADSKVTVIDIDPALAPTEYRKIKLIDLGDGTFAVAASVSSISLGDLNVNTALGNPLGHEQVVASTTPVALTVPANATIAIIENSPQGSGMARWRDDGTSPTGGGVAGEGHYLPRGVIMQYDGDLSAIEFIRDGSQDAVLEVSYYEG